MDSSTTFDSVLDRTMARGGIADRKHAERLLRAALEVLAERLGPAEIEGLSRSLPPRLVGVLTMPRQHGDPSTIELFEHVSTRAALPFGAAVEVVGAAFGALAAAMDAEALVLLQRRLPDDWARLFRPASDGVRFMPLRGTVPGHGHTLATGRPGAQHPLSEGRPSTTQSESVVSADNPHAARKLSSGQPDEADQSLATGRPGAEVPLSDRRDER